MIADPPPLSCPHCGAPRVDGPECPRCGVIYAKARPRSPSAPLASGADGATVEAAGSAAWGPLPGAAPAVWTGQADDARRELWIGALAPPAALGVMAVLVATSGGHMLVRTFLSMWIHELGHAVTAWWCGHGAFPGPWRTPVSAGRVPLVVALLAGGLLSLAWRGWQVRRPALVAAAAGGLLLQLACTALPQDAAAALITFGGDGGALVLGAVLVATIWANPDGRLGKGSLRWGFLVIGAAAVVDALDTWVRASIHPALLPLGEIEGVGRSDASKLLDVHGWSASELSRRYVALGVACLAALAVGWGLALARARARVREADGNTGLIAPRRS